MFDLHLHSNVSFDSTAEPREMLAAAERAGLSEICFTDHYDFHTDPALAPDVFTLERYANAYDGLRSDSVIIKRGVEFGMTEWNSPELYELLRRRDFDLVIGSVHYVNGVDPYFPEYWQGRSVAESYEAYLLQVLECVKAHDGFDVLGHLNYVCKSAHNPTGKTFGVSDLSDICDEIMKILVSKGKGMEINTSGVDRCKDFLPSAAHLKRFKELGGEIVTVGSDAHDPTRVGQYSREATQLVSDIFGYVCTFDNRRPVFHKMK